MKANTVYDIFLALSLEEQKKFMVLVKEHDSIAPCDLNKIKTKKSKFTKQDAVDYLLSTAFKPKY